MYGRSFFILFGAGLLGLLTIQNAPADPNDPSDAPAPVKGVEVQTRGPIHEAFAAPVDGQPRPSPVVPKAPPAIVDETPPDQKPEGDDVQWIPGYWQWDDERTDFTWISGFWRTPPPGRQWLPGHWDKNDDGWQWVSGYWAAPQQDQVTYLPPPPATIDIGPSTPAPEEDSLYVPGNWVYRETRYRWRPGYFVAARPDYVWIPAHYEWTPAGYVFVEGYWDYPLAERGLLFAPVCFDPVVLQLPDFVYTPQYVVSCDFLPTALFVRPSCRHYYFGDYFDDRYERRGFTPWIDFHIGRYCRDPLFEHYRSDRADRGWERGMRDLYDARRNGEAALPPRTLVQQNRLINDLAVNKPRRGSNLQQVSVLAPLAQVNTRTPLEHVPTSALNAQKRNADKFRELGTQIHQGQQGAQLAHKGPVQAGDTPHAVKVEMPQLTSLPTTRVRTPRPAAPPTPAPLHVPEIKNLPTPPAPAPGVKEVPTAPPGHHKEMTPPGPIPSPVAPPEQHKEITPAPLPPVPPAPVHPKEITPAPPAPLPPVPAPVHEELAPPPPAPVPPTPVHHKEVTPAPLPPIPAPVHMEIAPPALPAPVHHKEIAPPAPIAPPPAPPAPVHHKEVAPPAPLPPPPAPVHKEIAPPAPPPPPPPVHHKEVMPAPPAPPPPPVHREVAPPPPPQPVHHREVAPPAPAPAPAPVQRIAPPAPKPAPPAPPVPPRHKK